MAKNQKSSGLTIRATKTPQQSGNGSRLTGSRDAQARVTRDDLTQRIGERAYILWEKRGRVHGFDQQDWKEAEAQIKREFRIS